MSLANSGTVAIVRTMFDRARARFGATAALSDWVNISLRIVILIGAWMRFVITLRDFHGWVLAAWIGLLVLMTWYNILVLRISIRGIETMSRGWYGWLIVADTLFFSLLYVLSARPFSDLYLFYFLPLLIAAEHFSWRRAALFFAYITVAFLLSFIVLYLNFPGDLPLGPALLRNALPRWVFFLFALFIAFVRTKFLEQRSRELEAVRSTALKISANEGLAGRLQAVLAAATEILGTQGCKVYLRERDGSLLLVAATGLRSDRFGVGSRLAPDKGIAGYVLRTGQSVIENDYEHSILRIHDLAHLFGSVIEVPLIWEGKTVGVLGVFDHAPGRFSEHDRDILEKFGAHVSVAIHDIDLVEQLARQTKGLQGLTKASNALLAAAPDNQAVLEAVATHGWDLAKIFTTDPQYVLVALVNEQGIIDFASAQPPDYLQRLLDTVVNIDIYSSRRGVVGRTIATGTVQHVDDVENDVDYIPFNAASKAQLALPIRGRKRVLGVLSLEHSDPKGLPQELLSEPLQGLAAHAAAAIENVRLFQEIQERRERAEKLRDWAARLSSTPDLDIVGRLVLDGLRAIVPHDRATLQILEGQQRVMLASYGTVTGENPLLMRPADDDPLIARALASEDIFILDDPRADRHWEDLLETRDIETWCCAVLRFAGEPIGLITIDHVQKATYNDDSKVMLRLYLSHASSVLHAAMLLEANQRQVEQLTTTQDQLQFSIDYLAAQRNLALIGYVYGENIHHAQNHLGLARLLASRLAQDLGNSAAAREASRDIHRHIKDYLEIIEKFRNEQLENPTPTAFSLHATIDKVAASKRFGVIKLKRAYTPANDIVIAPESQVRQVFFVLMQNAIDAMPGGGTLTFETHEREISDTPGVVVFVRDTGKGISAEKQATLFEATVVETAESGRRGTRMGLMWAKSMMRSIGGDITFETGSGGTTMMVHVPRDSRKYEPPL